MTKRLNYHCIDKTARVARQAGPGQLLAKTRTTHGQIRPAAEADYQGCT